MTVFVVTTSSWCDEYENTFQEIVCVCTCREKAEEMVERTKKDNRRGWDVDYEEFYLV